MTLALKIPSTAPAGYSYWLRFERTDADSRLVLMLPYQVATITRSKSWTRRGGSITVSGRVPTVGHWGTTPGSKKGVVVYKRTSRAGVPTTWDATAKGWTRVGTFKADGYGRFKTRTQRPTRTTYYVARYYGDAQYDRGYTSVTRVYVR